MMFSSEQNFTINGVDDKALAKVLTLAIEREAPTSTGGEDVTRTSMV